MKRSSLMKSRTVRQLLFAAVLLGPGLAQAAGTAEAEVVQGKSFPFYPAFIQIEGKENPKVTDWQDPQMCMGCHPRQYEGWKSSMHSQSFVDPVFQAEWALGHKATDGATLNHCGGCHSPVGVVTGTIEFDPELGEHGGFTAPGVAAKGVSCDVCHTISGTNAAQTLIGDPGNASLIMSPGNVKRASLKDAKSPFHETAYSELHTKAELCANCHNIFHPDNRFPVEHTYDEWKMSPYAQRGIQCQDCHMVPVDTAIRVAQEMKRPQDLEGHGLGGIAGMGATQERALVHDHGFVGGNTVVAEAMGVPGADKNKAEAIKRLQNAADVSLDVLPGIGGANLLRVKVTNVGAGHHLPTSLTFVRQIWLEVLVKDDQGRTLLASGQLDEHNKVPAEAIKFNNTSVDKDGNKTMDPWRIASFIHMNTIPPKGYRVGHYSFSLPDGAKVAQVDVRLNYQSFPQYFADKLLGKDKLEVPTVEMKRIVVDITREQLAAAEAAGMGVMEWLAANQSPAVVEPLRTSLVGAGAVGDIAGSQASN